jgi:AhpD family alkylhydroperoxidase
MTPMKLDKKTLRLISVGASIGANCRACLETSIALALESGANEQEIEQAIAAGKKDSPVRHPGGPAGGLFQCGK